MSVKLKKLLKNLPNVVIKGSKEVEITGIASDSRLVVPGNLFIARKGLTYDGARFIPDALAAGASAIASDIYDPSLKGVTQIIAPNVQKLEADLAAEYYGWPSKELFVVGITGTNGKTTSAFVVKHLLDHLGLPCGLVGTVEQVIGTTRYTALRTTPDVVTNHKILREMIRHGCKAVAMEITSHALDQQRTRHIRCDIGIFTNLSQDHLDYHKTFDAYAQAKKKLFDQSDLAVVNGDDPWHERMIVDFPGTIITYGTSNTHDLYASNITLSDSGTSFTAHAKEQSAQIHLPLIGRFNVYNALSALAVGLVRGVSLQELSPILRTVPPIPGRLEPIQDKLGRKIYVDYAHTPDALKNVLLTLQEIKEGRIITLFGCGGNRDQEKRPLMGAVAAELSDWVVVTSDNPRSEEPKTICDDIVATIQTKKNWEVVIERRSAIAAALEHASPKDIVLIAGKGHETTQDFATYAIPFDDCAVVRQLCSPPH